MPKKCLTRQTGNRINKKYMKYVELNLFPEEEDIARHSAPNGCQEQASSASKDYDLTDLFVRLSGPPSAVVSAFLRRTRNT